MALSDYTQLEYIESTGTQYIDTEYKHNTSKTKYSMEVSITSTPNMYNALFGARTEHDSNDAYYVGITNNTNHTTYTCIGGTKVDPISGFNINFNTKYKIDIDPTRGITVNNTLYSIIYKSSITSSYNAYIFGFNTNNSINETVNMKLYSFKIYNDNNLVRDFIPVKRKSDNVLGLFDKVNNGFYTNAGTGNFIAGPSIYDGSQLQQNILEIQDLMEQCNDLSLDILGGTPKPDPLKDYKKLEYIQSTGSQYINTDINIGATTDIEVKFITVQAAGGYGRVWGSTSDMKYELADTGGNTGYRISINGTGYSFSTTNDIKIVKMTGNGTVFLNNSQIHNFNKSYTGGEKLWLFWGNSGDWQNVYGRIKLYYAKVWQDNKLVRNYMPVLRKEDNKVGLFDIQNNQFYIDVNNGNFTAGPEIN